MLRMLSEFIRRLFYIVPKTPANIQIGITNKCNFDCKMCQRFDLKVRLGDLPLVEFKKVLANIDNNKDITLTGWGEPLLHPELLEIIKLCKEKECRVRFTSNGNLLTVELANKLLDLGVDAITFSVDSINQSDTDLGHPVKEQLDNIKRFIQLIKERGAKTEVYLQSTYHKGKELELFDVVDFAKEVGVQRVRFSRLDVRFQKFERPTFKEEKLLIKNIEKKLQGTQIGIDFLPHIAADGLTKIFFKLLGRFLHRGGKYCLRTYNDLYINEDGLVTPCCALPNLVLGDAKKEPINEIWNNVHFKRFRKKQNIACGECDVLKIKPFNR